MLYLSYIGGCLTIALGIIALWRFAWELRRLKIFPKVKIGHSFNRIYDNNDNPIEETIEFSFVLVEMIIANNSSRALAITNMVIEPEPISYRDEIHVERMFDQQFPIKISPWEAYKISPIPFKEGTKVVRLKFFTSRYTKKKRITLKIPIESINK